MTPRKFYPADAGSLKDMGYMLNAIIKTVWTGNDFETTNDIQNEFSAKGFKFLFEKLWDTSVEIYLKMDLMLMDIYRIIAPANLTIRKKVLMSVVLDPLPNRSAEPFGSERLDLSSPTSLKAELLTPKPSPLKPVCHCEARAGRGAGWGVGLRLPQKTTAH